MITPRTLTALTTTLLVTCTACGTDGTAHPAPPSVEQTASSALSPSEWASLETEAGIPPEPDATTADAYITALQAIDPDIVHGNPDQALDRGRNVCQSIADGAEGEQLITSTNMRFTSPDHPDGFGQAVAAQILEHTRTYLCPGRG